MRNTGIVCHCLRYRSIRSDPGSFTIIDRSGDVIRVPALDYGVNAVSRYARDGFVRIVDDQRHKFHSGEVNQGGHQSVCQPVLLGRMAYQEPLPQKSIGLCIFTGLCGCLVGNAFPADDRRVNPDDRTCYSHYSPGRVACRVGVCISGSRDRHRFGDGPQVSGFIDGFASGRDHSPVGSGNFQNSGGLGGGPAEDTGHLDEDVKGIPGSEIRASSVIDIDRQSRVICQALRENGNHLVVRSFGPQIHILAENPFVLVNQVFQSVIIGGDVNPFRVNVGLKVCHSNPPPL